MTYSPLHSNKKEYISRRTKLRRNQTKAEQVLWYELKTKRLGFKFRRQFQIGKYIVDFYCHELRLIIELDGPIHEHQQFYDKQRQVWLENQGYKVIRYLNDEVLFDRDAVLAHLCSEMTKRKSEVLR